jgi:hypothetical protein
MKFNLMSTIMSEKMLCKGLLSIAAFFNLFSQELTIHQISSTFNTSVL